jgi:hypothetical protein
MLLLLQGIALYYFGGTCCQRSFASGALSARLKLATEGRVMYERIGQWTKGGTMSGRGLIHASPCLWMRELKRG